MMALSSETEERVLADGFGWSIPEGIELVAESGEIQGIGMGWSGSSGQTELDWQWVVRGAAVASGTLTWPEDYNLAARDHAVKLLDIAERSFQEGCAPAAPPIEVRATKPAGGVSPIDADRSWLDAAQKALEHALRSTHAKPCR